jgi:hypothetical protein
VVVARDEDHDALAAARVVHPPLHPERLADLEPERVLELRTALLEPVEVELGAHEEHPALGVGRVLVGAEDVRVTVREEAGDGGDDPMPVGARDEDAGNVPAVVHGVLCNLAFGVDRSRPIARVRAQRLRIGCGQGVPRAKGSAVAAGE